METWHKMMAFCVLVMIGVGQQLFYGCLKIFSDISYNRQEENLATSQNVGTGHTEQTGVDNSSTGDEAYKFKYRFAICYFSYQLLPSTYSIFL